jgi:hypothetical protein
VPKRGRGSGKSYFFADLLIEDHIRHKGTRAVCIREVQKTLAGSSKRPANSRRMPGMPSRLFVAPQQRAHRARDRRFSDAGGHLLDFGVGSCRRIPRRSRKSVEVCGLRRWSQRCARAVDGVCAVFGAARAA